MAAAPPGQKVARLKPATIAGHPGTLRMFFITLAFHACPGFGELPARGFGHN